MDISNADYIVRTTSAFKMLSDPTRFKILCALSQAKSGLCVYEIADAVSISQSAASHQMCTLEARGVVECFRDGQTICYEMRDTPFTKNLLHVMKIFKSPHGTFKPSLGTR